MEKKSKLSTRKIVFTALMAALVFVGSALRVRLPIAVGSTTSFHLGNIFCALSGLLLGPWLVWPPVLAPPFLICLTPSISPRHG